MSPTRAMVLAAGYGTRMGELTADRPKPLLPVAGKALIDHALDRVAEAGVTDVVVNLHYRAEMIRSHFAGQTSLRVVFSEEEPTILETGGGFVKARPMLGEAPVFTINSDAIWSGPPPLVQLVDAWDDAAVDALLLLVPVERAIGYTRAGDFHLDPSLRRRGTDATAPFVYSGAQIIRPSAFDGAPAGAFSTNLIWDRLLERKRIGGIVYAGDWVDVGTPDGLRAADALISKGSD